MVNFFRDLNFRFTHYSSVPNRRVGQNKRAGGKIRKNIKHVDQNKAVLVGFFFSQN